ncbi:L-fucose:H+ symporter permease [bacterium AH-315-K03]|nr:L-fucose:H+ symporter permease [bacterium AH-315-K03]
MPNKNNKKLKVALVDRKIIKPFIMVTLLFPLWGFANDITNPLVRVFKDIFLISNMQSSLVQFSFYFGYGVMALPAAIFIRKYSYKAGILVGLLLYAIGASLFFPASYYADFNYFLLALFILTCGLAFLETTANPYILTMGDPKTASRRLNLSQAFNPLGSLFGMFVASSYILKNLEVEKFREQEKLKHAQYSDMLPSVVDTKLSESLENLATNEPLQFLQMQSIDLETIRAPYLAIAVIVFILFLVFLFFDSSNQKKQTQERVSTIALVKNFIQLFKIQHYREGVIAQTFYVGAQIMCWTFIIHYGMSNLGLSAQQAQQYNMVAMISFLIARLIATYLLGYVNPSKLLLIAGCLASIFCTGAIFLEGMTGLYSLVCVSACMSLMFPTIYSLTLQNLGKNTSLGSAGLVMAIVGGALMPPLQAALIDAPAQFSSISALNQSFVLPLFCFFVVSFFALRTLRNAKE